MARIDQAKIDRFNTVSENVLGRINGPRFLAGVVAAISGAFGGAVLLSGGGVASLATFFSNL